MSARPEDVSFNAKTEELSQRFDKALRDAAQNAAPRWFNRTWLDEVLLPLLKQFPDCELVYAIDVGGRQMSSNLHQDRIDADAYWQDLSQRPIAMPLRALGSDAHGKAFVCDTYISKATNRSCLTVMFGVRSDSALLGFIALDFADL